MFTLIHCWERGNGDGHHLLLSVEELLVLLLGLLEGLLEEVGVYRQVSQPDFCPHFITGSLTLAVGKADGQGLSLGLTLADIGGGIPHPAAVRADVGAQLHVGDDYTTCQYSMQIRYTSWVHSL